MEIKKTILNYINNIFEEVSKNGQIKPIEDTFKKELTVLSKYFNTTKIEAYVIVIVFGETLDKGGSVNYKALTKRLKWPTIKILEYNEVFENLIKNKYLIREIPMYANNSGFIDYNYMVNTAITESIIKNKALPNINETKEETIVDIFEKIYNITGNVVDQTLLELSFNIDLSNMLDKAEKFEFFKKLKQLNISEYQQFLYVAIIWKTLVGDKMVTAEDLINKMGISVSDKVKYIQKFMNPNTNKLLSLDLINIETNDFINDSIVDLSSKTLKLLEKENIKINLNTSENLKGIIQAKDIVKTKLFFQGQEKQQLDMLQTVLMQKNYNELQKRLKEKQLPKGLTAILFGFPGTGKTESVFQMAKRSGRAIMQVDISQTKSKWFGESEKIIKKIFTDYYKFKEQEKRTPILLFNEADAIISKRKDLNSSNLAQTENAIQNIILEELEKFEGILMATTNMHKNMDSAFERRFLFKVEFQRPSVNILSKIWKARVKTLTINESKMLAEKYHFTGGQINNIIRKMEMQEVISGKKTDFEIIDRFCKEELFDKKNKSIKIGFSNTGKQAM